jgi:hypothetical protein
MKFRDPTITLHDHVHSYTRQVVSETARETNILTGHARPLTRRLPSCESLIQSIAAPRQVVTGDHDLPSSMRRLELGGHGSRVRRRITSSPYSYTSEPESSRGKSSEAQGHIIVGGVRHSSLDCPDAEDSWMRHAEALEGGGSSAQYRCAWVDLKTGHGHPCGYIAKKHLVKRHIESKHLQIK